MSLTPVENPLPPPASGTGVSPVWVEIQPCRPSDEDEIEIVPDLDVLVSTEVMLSCGEDNPY
ncbi:hypothetical protein GCM10027091_65970 [Streptomyces daliensis]